MPSDRRSPSPGSHPTRPTRPAPPIARPAEPHHEEPPHSWPAPEAHRRHGDYAFVEGYGWWPRWYPYSDPSWYAYWQYLYDYYGGEANAEYAEYARDAALRSIAEQQGWL